MCIAQSDIGILAMIKYYVVINSNLKSLPLFLALRRNSMIFLQVKLDLGSIVLPFLRFVPPWPSTGTIITPLSPPHLSYLPPLSWWCPLFSSLPAPGPHLSHLLPNAFFTSASTFLFFLLFTVVYRLSLIFLKRKMNQVFSLLSPFAIGVTNIFLLFLPL